MGMGLTLLPSTKLLDALLLVLFAIERDADAYASVVLHALALLVIGVILIAVSLVGFALDDKTPTTSWDETLEYRRKLFGNLLESALDGLIFSLVQDGHQFFN